MRAAVVERYGGPEVVALREVRDPEIHDDELLVRVEATTIGPTDAAARSGRPAFARLYFGLMRPRHAVLGFEFAGVVERVGSSVRRFAPGDRVHGALGPQPGAHAEFVRIAEGGLVAHVPAGWDPVDAVAIVDGFLTAIPFLRDGGRVRRGDRVLVNGASGAVGSAAVRFAKHLGAEVVGVCGPAHLDLVRSLGADRVVDYTREDIVTTGERYDVVFDAVGTRSFRECRRVLTADGIYLSTVPSLPVLLRTRRARSTDSGQRAANLFTGLHPLAEKAADLALVGELAAAEAIRPVVDRVLALDDVVEAHRIVDGGHKGGNLVIAIPAVE